jgi:hypothetical protein
MKDILVFAIKMDMSPASTSPFFFWGGERLMSNGLAVLLPILFLISAVALILVCAVSLLAEAFPVIAVAVAIFAMVLLVVLCAVVLRRE